MQGCYASRIFPYSSYVIWKEITVDRISVEALYLQTRQTHTSKPSDGVCEVRSVNTAAREDVGGAGWFDEHRNYQLRLFVIALVLVSRQGFVTPCWCLHTVHDPFIVCSASFSRQVQCIVSLISSGSWCYRGGRTPRIEFRASRTPQRRGNETSLEHIALANVK